MKQNKILNLCILVLLSVLSVLLFFHFNNKTHIKKYFLPEEIEIILKNEKFFDNFHLLNSIPEYEKNQIFENYNKFLKLNDDEKILITQNYIQYLQYDTEKRKRLKEIYKEIFDDM